MARVLILNSTFFTVLVCALLSSNLGAAQESSGTVFLWDLPDETALLTPLGTLPTATLPSECQTISDYDSVEFASSALLVTIGCDQRSRASCCLPSYRRLGYYAADRCPEGFTPTSERAYGITIGTRTETGSICCPSVQAPSDWSRDGHRFIYTQDEQENDILLSVYCLWYNTETVPISHSGWVVSAPAVFIIPSAAETSSSFSTSAGSSPGSQNTQGTNPTDSATPGTADSGKGGLPTGAIVGIAVGVGVPVIAIVAFIVWKLTRAQKAQKPGPNRDATWAQTGGLDEDAGTGGYAEDTGTGGIEDAHRNPSATEKISRTFRGS